MLRSGYIRVAFWLVRVGFVVHSQESCYSRVTFLLDRVVFVVESYWFVLNSGYILIGSCHNRVIVGLDSCYNRK